MFVRRLAVCLIGTCAALAVLMDHRPRRPHWIVDHTIVNHTPRFDIVRTGYIDHMNLAGMTSDHLFGGEGRFMYVGGATDPEMAPQQALFRPESVVGWIKDQLASSRLLRRLRPVEGPLNFVSLSTGTIVVAYDRIYRSPDGGRTFEPVYTFPDATSRPHPYGMSNATFRDEIYFGELTFATTPHPVRVYQGSDDGRSWRVIYTFPPGMIGHVHSMIYDRWRDRVWIGTGDHPETSKLAYTDDGFKTVRVLGEGDLSWRVSGMIATKDYLYWGSDDGADGAHLYRYDLAQQRRQYIQALGSPVWHGASLQDGTLVFSAAYEPSIPFTREHRPPARAILWVSRNGVDWYQGLTFDYAPAADPRKNAAIGLSYTNTLQPALYLSPYGAIDKEFTVQRYEIHWR